MIRKGMIQFFRPIFIKKKKKRGIATSKCFHLSIKSIVKSPIGLLSQKLKHDFIFRFLMAQNSSSIGPNRNKKAS